MFQPRRPNLFFKEITFAKKRIIKIINQAHIYILLCLGNIYVKAEVWIGGILYLTGELNHIIAVQRATQTLGQGHGRQRWTDAHATAKNLLIKRKES